MDSDDDGTYGYDIPDDGGSRFKLKPSHVLGGGDSSDDDDNGDVRRMMGSSDEDDEDGEDHDNKSFSYGSFAKRKRKYDGKKSKGSDKERNLYGVFYDSSSEDEAGGRHGGGKKSRTSRHFDKRQNRLAGLAFVKASSDAATEAKEQPSGVVGGGGEKDTLQNDGARSAPAEEPDWLKEKASYEQKDEAIKSEVEKIQLDQDGEGDIQDEEEVKAVHEREARFKELLARATTSRNPISSAIKKQKPKQAEEPITSTENETVHRHDKDSSIGFGGIGSRGIGIHSARDDRNDVDEQPAVGSGLGFVSSGSHSHKTDANDETKSQQFFAKSESDDYNGKNKHTPSFAAGGAGLGLGMAGQQGLDAAPAESFGGMQSSQGLGLGMGSGMGMGLGLGSNFPTLAQTMSIGLGGSNMNSVKPMKKRDPTLGTWEKHTKGIGMKLLQKMGYQGSGGLGAIRKRKAPGSTASDQNEKSEESAKEPENTFVKAGTTNSQKEEETVVKKGISRPVEVVVRPAGLGLGYGSFKEASQLKVNRQIEAEVRGLDQSKDETQKKEKDDDDNDGKGLFDGVPKSLLPSTQSLLSQGAQSWRKGKGNKKAKRKIVMYQDIIDQNDAASSDKMKIIDMRGPSATAAYNESEVSSSTATVALGEELLHNVTLLLNTHESQLRTSSYMVKSAQRKIDNLEAEGAEMLERQKGIAARIDKMQLALGVINQAEELTNKISEMDTSSTKTLDIAVGSLQRMISNLYSSFTKEERESLKFDTTLIPSIVTPVFDLIISKLQPLKIDLSWMTHISSGINHLCSSVGSDDESYALREMIFMKCIVPWIQNALSLSKWDPILDVEVGLGLYESLMASIDNACSITQSELHTQENDILKEEINEEIVQNVIQPKLLRAVGGWKPKFDRKNHLMSPMHLWILPWLPHLKKESVLGTILTDVRRKLKSTISFLGKSETDDSAFARSCIQALSPWRNLYPESTMFDLTSESVTPRLARSLARIDVAFPSSDQNWDQIHVLFEYFGQGLMSADDFLSLVDSEVLPVWANTLHISLQGSSLDMPSVKAFYITWKKQLFDTMGQKQTTKLPMPQLILQSDSVVCGYFFGGLEMMRAVLESNEDMLASLEPPNPANCNYRISLMNRAKDKKAPLDSSNNTRVHQVKVRSDGKMASFQEVVADFARHHDIAFHPKIGSKSTKDGKPVFMFGDHSVYFDKNVLFTLRGGSWQPISLEHLAQMS